MKGLGKKGNQHAARLAAEARQALAVSSSSVSCTDRQMDIPATVAAAIDVCRFFFFFFSLVFQPIICPGRCTPDSQAR